MKKKQYGLCKMTWHVCKLCCKKLPFLFLLYVLLGSSTGLFRTANVFFKQTFFESVEELAVAQSTITKALFYGVVLMVVIILIHFLQTVSELTEENFYKTVIGYLGKDLNKKASRVEPIIYEDKQFLELINKAYVGLEAVMEVAGIVLFVIFTELSYFVTMGYYFYSIKPWLLLTFVISLSPHFICALIRKKQYANLEHQEAPYRRKQDYFSKCISSREYAKETRLWRANSYFIKLFRENLRRATMLEQEVRRKAALIEIGLRFLQLVGHMFTLILLVYYLMQGDIRIGAFAAIYSSLNQIYERIEILFRDRIPYMMEGIGPAQNYFEFLSLKERQGSYDGKLERKQITFEGVSFTYPGSNRRALEQVNLTIRKGETLAIVGVNGSGKSTLTRLLMGLYLPTEGTVSVDGIDMKTVSPKNLYQGVSAVFQRYQCYKMTVKDNVRISETESDKLPESVLGQVDFSLQDEKFTDGIDTMLGKDFGGIDLSGGQWQRLAIAKGLYRVHDMIILDEPTAAIDPIEEAAIYRKFAEISKDKTAIIVTHRLGSVHMADRIIVMDAGQIVDIGKHEELMEKKGLYYEMYQAQAKWYA